MRLQSRLDKIYYFTYGHLTVDTLEDREYARDKDLICKYTTHVREGRDKWWHRDLPTDLTRLYEDKLILTTSMSKHFPLKWKLPYRRRFFNKPTQYEWRLVGQRATYQKNEYRFNINYRYSKQPKYARPWTASNSREALKIPKKKKKTYALKAGSKHADIDTVT